MFNILAVDDNSIILEAISLLLRTNLSSIQHRVVTAADGKDAWLKIEKNQPDLVITDVRMPNLNGLELTMLIKGKYPGIPVILMTTTTQNIPIDFPSDDVLIKPFTSQALVEAILFQYRQISII